MFSDPFAGINVNLASGAYPNLYAGGKEAGNLIRFRPITLTNGQNYGIESTIEHLPINTNNSPSHTLMNGNFRAPAITGTEINLLRQYGKVFFYEVDVFDGATFVGKYIMHPKIETVNTTPLVPSTWENIQNLASVNLQGTAPNGVNYDLYYYYAGLGGTNFNMSSPGGPTDKCDSREVVFQVPTSWGRQMLPNGQYLNLKIIDNNYTFWLNSTLALEVSNN